MVRTAQSQSRISDHTYPAPLRGDQGPVVEKLYALYNDLLQHDGYGELKVRMRFLKKGQKEVVLQFGKEYRFVVDYPPPAT